MLRREKGWASAWDSFISERKRSSAALKHFTQSFREQLHEHHARAEQAQMLGNVMIVHGSLSCKLLQLPHGYWKINVVSEGGKVRKAGQGGGGEFAGANFNGEGKRAG
jgi:hypothetical protein